MHRFPRPLTKATHYFYFYFYFLRCSITRVQLLSANSMHLELLTKQYGRIRSVSGSVQNSDPGLQILIFYYYVQCVYMLLFLEGLYLANEKLCTDSRVHSQRPHTTSTSTSTSYDVPSLVMIIHWREQTRLKNPN
jgi:hypothetical protein